MIAAPSLSILHPKRPRHQNSTLPFKRTGAYTLAQDWLKAKTRLPRLKIKWYLPYSAKRISKGPSACIHVMAKFYHRADCVEQRTVFCRLFFHAQCIVGCIHRQIQLFRPVRWKSRLRWYRKMAEDKFRKKPHLLTIPSLFSYFQQVLAFKPFLSYNIFYNGTSQCFSKIFFGIF